MNQEHDHADELPAFVRAVHTIDDLHRVLGDEVSVDGFGVPLPADAALSSTSLEAMESGQGYDEAAKLLRVCFTHPRYRDVAIEEAFNVVSSPENRMFRNEDHELLAAAFRLDGTLRKRVHELLVDEVGSAEGELKLAIERQASLGSEAPMSQRLNTEGETQDYARLAADAQRRVLECSNHLQPAITQGFRLWESGRLSLRDDEPQESQVAALFHKAKLLLEKTINLVKGRGFQDAEDLFSAIRDGGKQMWRDGYATTRSGNGTVDLADPAAQIRAVDSDEVREARSRVTKVRPQAVMN